MTMQQEIVLLRKRRRDVGDSSIQQTQKIFLRKTARGKVIKVLREHYLRPDIPCGSQACTACQELYDQPVARLLPFASRADDMEEVPHPTASPIKPVLSIQGRDPIRASGNKRHYLLLDTNVVLHQMDVVESPDFGSDIIILQTVLDEVRHRSLPLYNRLLSLTNDETRRISVFSNEARFDTFASRIEGETPNDRNDRAIRVATKWYSSHLQEALASTYKTNNTAVPLDVVLLSDDSDNRKKAALEGVMAASVRDYVEALPKQTSLKLLDLVAAGEEAETTFTAGAKHKSILFPEYLATSMLLAGVKSGQLFQGIFHPNPYNYLEGSVNVYNTPKPILLIGRTNMNRATDGDTVVVELLPESEWKAPADEVFDREEMTGKENDNPDESDEEDVDEDGVSKAEQREQEISRRGEKQPTGKVVGVMKRAWRSYVCHLDRTSLSPAALDSQSPQNVFARPVDKKIPKIRIKTRQVSTLANQKFLVAIDRWDVTTRHPSGHFVRALGTVETKEAEIESLLLEFDVPYRPFPKAILDCLPPQGEQWKVPPKTSSVWQNRQDLRDLIVCSIDPIGCQDIDDALHARKLPNGNIEAGVHIADVSHFVKPDNPMDAEAASRGTTVYLVDKRIDMLPPLLGTNLCSLRPYVERLAFSVLWEMDADANIVNVRFTKSVIASKAAFSYEDAQLRKDDKTQTDELTESIRLLNTLAIKLRNQRLQAGALNLASPEVKIHLDSSESTGPIDVEAKEHIETNSLVEEFMLLANISVAKRIYEQYPQTAVLRRHLAPPSANFEVLKDVLKKRKNLDLDTSSNGALAHSLDQCIDPSMPNFNTLVRIMATRCMLPAEYFCSGSVGRDTFGHYGLASPIYTHFTSPIRRYADILVHRELFAAISNTPLHTAMYATSHVDRIMDNINKRHRLAQQAGRASVEFYVALALKGKQEASVATGNKVIEEAFVIRAFRNGLAVFVTKFGLEGLVIFKREIEYDSETYEIKIPNDTGHVRIGVFDKVLVELTVEKDQSTQRGRVKMRKCLS